MKSTYNSKLFHLPNFGKNRVMIDTCNLWIDSSSIANGNPFVILPYLDNVTERENERIGYSCGGRCSDYSIDCYQSGISLKGSLAKFYLPSNVFTLTRQSISEAIEKMSDILHIDINTARVNRVDISTIIPTTRPPSDYYQLLGNKPHFERLQASKDTLYYNTQKRQLIFYDKTKEATAKSAIIPQSLCNTNLLRYELRFKKRISQQFMTDNITANKLYDSDFYYSLIKEWRLEFETIKKINLVDSMANRVKTPKEAQTALFAKLLQQSGQSEIDNYLADLRANKVFADPKYYTRLKGELNKILQAPNEAKSNLIQELEKAITDVAKYAR